MSCTTNVARKLTQVQDKSHHREAFQQQQRQPGFRSQNHGDLNDEFSQFAAPAEVNWQFQAGDAPAINYPVQQNPPGQAAHANSYQFGFGRPEHWVQQFQSMSMDTAQNQQQIQDPMLSPLSQQSHSQPFSSFAPRYPLAESFGRPLHLEPTRAIPKAPQEHQVQENEFDKAFLAAETRMNALTSLMNPGLAPGEKVDLQGVAKEVLNTVESSTTSDKMADKMKNSGFMNLMLQLSNKQATVKDNQIVTEESASSPIEWQGPKLKEVEIKQPLYQEKLRDPVGGQQPKEAVEDYLHRIGTPDGIPKIEDPGRVPSAFEAANEFGPETVPISSWEEDYSEWVGQ